MDLEKLNLLEYIINQLVSYIGLLILYPDCFIHDGYNSCYNDKRMKDSSQFSSESFGAKLFVSYMVKDKV
jgi:hypothetical protein